MTATDWITQVVVPIITFVLGFLVSRFTMSKAERREDQRKRFDLSTKLREGMDSSYRAFTEAIKEYVDAEEASFEHFCKIATTGQDYLSRMKNISDAILTSNIDETIRDESCVPQIKDCATRTLPLFYEKLAEIAKKKGFSYPGEFVRVNYESLFTVTDKYGTR